MKRGSNKNKDRLVRPNVVDTTVTLELHIYSSQTQSQVFSVCIRNASSLAYFYGSIEPFCDHPYLLTRFPKLKILVMIRRKWSFLAWDTVVGDYLVVDGDCLVFLEWDVSELHNCIVLVPMPGKRFASEESTFYRITVTPPSMRRQGRPTSFFGDRLIGLQAVSSFRGQLLQWKRSD